MSAGASNKHIGSVAIDAIAAGSAIIGKVGIDQTTSGTTNAVYPLATENHIGQVLGHAFKQASALTTTNGAYSASDVVGAKFTLTNIARVSTGLVLLQSIAVQCKSTQTGALTLLIFDADPTGTTLTDNTALSVAAADIFKVKVAVPITQYRNLGTGVVYTADNLAILLQPSSGKDLYAALITETAWTLTSTSDISVDVKALQVT